MNSSTVRWITQSSRTENSFPPNLKNMPRVALVTPHVTLHDAVCNDVFGMSESLGRRGRDARIYAADWTVSETQMKVWPVSRIRDFLRSTEDTLIYHHSMGWETGCDLLADLNCRKIVRYHNVTPPTFFSGWSEEYESVCRAGREQLSATVRSGCDAYLSASEYNMAELIAEGAPASRSFVVPPFNRINDFFDAEPEFEIIDRFRDGQTNLLMVGSLVPNKGHVALLEAFAAYNHDYQHDSRLFLVGKNKTALASYTSFLHEVTDRLGLRDRVIFTGEVSESELKSYYLLSDLFVMASEHEGFCVPLVEAMAMKVPIVAFGSAAIPETVSKAGLVWDERDPYLFAECVDTLIKDESLRMRLSLLGKQRYDELFTTDKIELKFLTAVGELL
jgi:glycosyltransferase involved in cell wall biosynthesis